MRPEGLVDDRVTDVEVGEDAAACRQVEPGLFDFTDQAVAAAELDTELGIQPLELQLVDGRELHHADVEIVHTVVAGILDVHVHVDAVLLEGGAHIAVHLQEALGKPGRVGTADSAGQREGFLRIAIRQSHVVIDGVLLFLGGVQVDGCRQAVVAVHRPFPGLLCRILVAVEIILDVEHQLAGRPVIGQVAAHGVLHAGRLQHGVGIEATPQVTEKGIVTAIQPGAEAFFRLGLQIKLRGRQEALVSRCILRTETAENEGRAVGTYGGQLDGLIRRKIVEVAIRTIENRIVEMHVETVERIVDVNGNRRFLETVQIDIVGAAHFHRSHLRPKRKQGEKQANYRQDPFHRFTFLSWFMRFFTCSRISSPSPYG